MPVALVLSGGTTKGDFEVGAIKFLYEQGIRPDIICGTSVGAVNAAKLAEGEGLPTQGLAGLIDIWENQIKTPGDVFAEEPWLSTIDQRVKGALGAVAGGGEVDLGLHTPRTREDTTWGYFAWAHNNIADLIDIGMDAAWLADMGQALLKGLRALMSARAIVNYGPLRALMGTNFSPGLVAQWAQAAPERALRLAMVSLDSGVLRYMTETGALVERDQQTPVLAPAHTESPNCTALEGQVAALRAARQDMIKADTEAGIKLGKDLELRAIGLQITDVQRQLTDCWAQPAVTSPPVPVVASLVEGVIASSSQPGIMPAVTFGGESYVDGGIRQTLPLQAAIDLGATAVWAIQTGPAGVAKKGPYSGAGGIDVAARAITEILMDEIAAGNEAAGAGHDVKFIRPVVTVHEAFEVDPGLMKISIDYGYMRAADVFHSVETETSDLGDRITTMRREIWQIEAALAMGPPAPTVIVQFIQLAQVVVPTLRSKKRALHRLIMDRSSRGAVVPAGLAGQWLEWERHALPIESPSPWGAITIAGIVALPVPDLGDYRVFDDEFYLSEYADLSDAFGSDLAAATNHWSTQGLSNEGRRGSREFAVQFYLGHNADLQNAFGTNYAGALWHWLDVGLPEEGRRGSVEFDVRYYLATYTELDAAFGTDYNAALTHWLNLGLPNEGRRGSLEFDVQYYLATYADLGAAFGTDYIAALAHWLHIGSWSE